MTNSCSTNNNNMDDISISSRIVIVVSFHEVRETLWLVTFSNDDNTTVTASSKAEACQGMSRAMGLLCSDDDTTSLQIMCARPLESPWCEKLVAIVPNMSRNTNHQPQFALQLLPPNNNNSTTSVDGDSYVQWIITMSNITKTLSNSPFFPNIHHHDIATTATNNMKSALHGQGMHQTLTYAVPIPMSSLSNNNNNHTILQFLPQEIYVETFQNNYNCRITSTSTMNSTSCCQCHISMHPQEIDIEQPSFVSSQHIIPYTIVVVGNCNDNNIQQVSQQQNEHHHHQQQEMAVQFDTTIHFRYPLTNNDRLVQVIIERPHKYCDYSSVMKSSTSSSSSNALFVSSTAIAGLNSSTIIVTNLPTGSDADLWFVSIITILVIWLGTIQMFRTIIAASSSSSLPNKEKQN